MTAETFRALLLEDGPQGPTATVRDLARSALPDGEVLVRIDYSCLNYKDALALTGRGKIVRSYPIVPGADYAGTVEESASPDFAPGERVVLTGWGVGERHWGGLARYARARADWLIRLPDGLSPWEAMAFGTAGLTAALCVLALEWAGERRCRRRRDRPPGTRGLPGRRFHRATGGGTVPAPPRRGGHHRARRTRRAREAPARIGALGGRDRHRRRRHPGRTPARHRLRRGDRRLRAGGRDSARYDRPPVHPARRPPARRRFGPGTPAAPRGRLVAAGARLPARAADRLRPYGAARRRACTGRSAARRASTRAHRRRCERLSPI